MGYNIFGNFTTKYLTKYEMFTISLYMLGLERGQSFMDNPVRKVHYNWDEAYNIVPGIFGSTLQE